MKDITAERVREIYDYEPETGIFRFRPRPVRPDHKRLDAGWNTKNAGRIAGCASTKGYIEIWIDGRLCKAHRVAWLLVHGDWPIDQIDHQNVVPADNRIHNLRAATNSQNAANRRVSRINRLGVKGVYQDLSGRYEAYTKSNGRKIYLGRFATLHEAREARRIATHVLFAEFARP